MAIFEDNAQSIGQTPLVRLKTIANPKATVLVKIEGRNPAFSIKDRVAFAMIQDAEEKGLLRKGMTIVEPTSGNTGIGLAFVAASRGYGCILTMPETMSIERRKVLAMLGAKLILTQGSLGMKGAIEKAEELKANDPERYFLPQQFKNPANPLAHEKTTGPELWNDTDGKIDVLVAAVGTGGTITGISRYFKKVRKSALLSVAVEPKSSAVISQYLAGETLTPSAHKIQGIGAGFIPETLDLSLIDLVEQVSDEEAMEYARRLSSEEGILCGISSGAAAAVACRLADQASYEGKVIVAILPDLGERYISSPLFAGLGE